MEWQVADQKAFVLTEQLSMDLAEGRAWGMKLDAFGTLTKVTSVFQKPKEDDFQLAYKELRYEPLWHISVMFKSVYQRERQYRMAPKGPEVRSVTILGQDFAVEAGQVTLTGMEHCEDEGQTEVWVDGITGKRSPNLANLIRYGSKQITAEELATFAPAGAIVQAPTMHAAALVKEVLGGMVKTVEADEILGEGVAIQAVELYFRPIYAFQFHWVSKDKYGVVECDALTGQYKADGKVLKDSPVEMPNGALIFDLQKDAMDTLLPGEHVTIPGPVKK
ncbi:MAG: hypothetical protein LLG44_05610 [Chloroflexi bacterium]|nr:hypothetical protein [Chloroflexota bacterium]